MTSNVVISEVVAVVCVVLSKVEKHVPYGGLVGTTEYTKIVRKVKNVLPYKDIY